MTKRLISGLYGSIQQMVPVLHWREMSQQYENVTLEQSKNVPLTGSGWTGAGRTAIDEPSREGRVGHIGEGEGASHYASGSSGRVGRERTACEAAVESAEKTW